MSRAGRARRKPPPFPSTERRTPGATSDVSTLRRKPPGHALGLRDRGRDDRAAGLVPGQVRQGAEGIAGAAGQFHRPPRCGRAQPGRPHCRRAPGRGARKNGCLLTWPGVAALAYPAPVPARREGRASCSWSCGT
jgi:hypothetical protein